ncbi:alpha/beta hydrolase [Streptomyces sp. NPDC007896]|uniref:alpha/beta hydrolase n=1 Tax=Streptomyces sp. NPDC007896 TaxID=3364784 RepID=UPI0036E040B5
MQNVTFINAGNTMAGNLYLPDGFSEGRSYLAIVSVHPGGGVKEQTAGLYAGKLAREGFVTLAFDASHQGESGGRPRHLENPASRVEDIRSAVDYLSTLGYVDAGRIGVLGICAGAGYAVNATMTDRRIKAVGTVSPIDIGAAYRLGWDGSEPVAAHLATLDAVAKQRAAEAQGADAAHVPYVPETVDETTVPDMAEAHDYYRTPRARHPRSDNRMLFTSVANIYLRRVPPGRDAADPAAAHGRRRQGRLPVAGRAAAAAGEQPQGAGRHRRRRTRLPLRRPRIRRSGDDPPVTDLHEVPLTRRRVTGVGAATAAHHSVAVVSVPDALPASHWSHPRLKSA